MQLHRHAFGLYLLLCGGCQQLLDLSDYKIPDPSGASQACPDASVCDIRTNAAAVPVSKQCPIVYGASSEPRSLRIGAVFDLSGPESAVGAMQAHSSELAIEQLNKAGGVQLRAETEARPLTLIVCDRALDGAVRTLVTQLGVKALIGPAWSHAYADVASDLSIPDDVVLLGPNALSEATASTRGGSAGALTWGMELSEADRVPMLLAQLRALEAQLSEQPRPLQLALVMRADGPMTSVRISQAQLGPIEQGSVVDLQRSISSYEYRDNAELSAIVSKLASQAPHIIVADGASEVVSELIAPLEARLSADPDAHAPMYLLSEAAQVPQLLQLAQDRPALQARVSMIGAVPDRAAQPVYEQFESAYRERYGQAPRAVTGVTASYSAVYAFAFGLMAADDPLRYGTALALGLRQLTGGRVELTTTPADVSKLLDALHAQQSVTVTGTLGQLAWTNQGSPRGALVGVYCLQRQDGSWSFVSTGYRYNVASGALAGGATPCTTMQAVAKASAAQSDTGDKPRAAKDMDAGKEPPPGKADAGAPAADSGTAQELSATDVGLALQYYPLNTSPFDSVVSPALKIINRTAGKAISLCSLRARYYFTNEHPEDCPQNCTIDGFYSGLQPSGMSISAERSYHPAGPDNPSAYLEVGFPCSHIMLGEGESVEVQQQFHTEPYRDFDETDDYSFRLFPTAYTDSDFVTLYQDGKLVWGIPPH